LTLLCALTATTQSAALAAPAPGPVTLEEVRSDSHNVYADTAVRGPNSDFNGNGRYNDPVYGGGLNLADGDFWPGQYSRTHVGAASFSYKAVMDGIRAGRVWVDHGGLISGLDAQLRSGGRRVTLGDTLHVRRGSNVDLIIEISLANGPNWAQFVPQLARVDVIQGDVTGPVSDKDAFSTPNTKVVKSFEVNKATGSVRLTYSLGRVDKPVYVRLRGTDGNRGAVGLNGAAVDPTGPAMDVLGDADPWKDLWFYSNPMWVLPA
ncbi:histidinol-phosphatase, partial [Streptomyces sp. NPDC001139]